MKKSQILMLVIVITTGCLKKQEPQPETGLLHITQVIGTGRVIPGGGISELASPVAGIVTGLPITEGSKVKKGDILVQLDKTDQMLAVQEITNKITTQQKAVESQKWFIEQKNTALADKLRKLTDAQELLKSGATAGENVRILQNDYEQASREMKKLENDLAMERSQLDELYVQQTAKMNNLKQTALRAPVDGIVLDIIPKLGEAVVQYQTYARLAPDAPLMVQTEIDEMFAAKVEPGQQCSVFLSGEKEPVAIGRVIRISADLKKKSLFSDSRDDLEDRRVREAEITLDTVFHALLIDTKVECSIRIN